MATPNFPEFRSLLQRVATVRNGCVLVLILLGRPGWCALLDSPQVRGDTVPTGRHRRQGVRPRACPGALQGCRFEGPFRVPPHKGTLECMMIIGTGSRASPRYHRGCYQDRYTQGRRGQPRHPGADGHRLLFVELFIAGGRAMVSVPGAALAAPGAVTITADAPGVVLHNATIWSMGSAF